MEPQLGGIHHLTAISAQIGENKRFFTETLGMRLVKRSVNQDDVSAYHLFYADALGSPGAGMTFFDWPVPRERRAGLLLSPCGSCLPGQRNLKNAMECFYAPRCLACRRGPPSFSTPPTL